MQTFYSLHELQQANLPDLCVTIGNFDGIHQGHQALLRHLESLKQQAVQASGKETQTLVITFDPYPTEFFQRPVARIFTLKQKLQLLTESKLVDNLLVINFDQEFANQPAEDFVRSLCEQNKIVQFLLGHDFRFGKDRLGSIQTFYDLAPQFGFKVAEFEQINHPEQNQQRVSSTYIRELLAQGNFAEANSLLISPFYLMGVVQEGRKLARNLNSPTANFPVDYQVSPVHGTYVCEVTIGDDPTRYPTVCNIGYKPTINSDKSQWLCEAHLLNFNQDLYGKEIKVFLCEKLRDEQKFSSLDALRLQIAKDIAQAKAYFNLD